MLTERPAEKMTVLKVQQMKKEKKPLDVGITAGSSPHRQGRGQGLKLNDLEPTTNVLV